MGLDIQIILLISGAISTVITGIFVAVLSHKFKQKMNEAEAIAKERKEQAYERAFINSEFQDASCVYAQQVYRAIKTGQHNGEFEAAYEQLRAVSCKKQTLDRTTVITAEKGE